MKRKTAVEGEPFLAAKGWWKNDCFTRPSKERQSFFLPASSRSQACAWWCAHPSIHLCRAHTDGSLLATIPEIALAWARRACTIDEAVAPMDDLPLDAKILKSLIAPARYSDGPTLYLICATNASPRCTIYEQTPEGTCRAWPEVAARGVQQAEGMIYQRTNVQD